MNTGKLGEELCRLGIVPYLVHVFRNETDVCPHDHVRERVRFDPPKKEFFAAWILIKAVQLIDGRVATDV